MASAFGGFQAGSIVAKLKMDKGDWNKAVRTVRKDMNSFRGAADKTNRSMKSLTSSVIKLGAAYLGIRGISKLARSFLDVASSTEQFRLRLDTLLGSQEAGAEAMELR